VLESRRSYKHFVIVFLPLMERTITGSRAHTIHTSHPTALYFIPQFNVFMVPFVPFASLVSPLPRAQWPRSRVSCRARDGWMNGDQPARWSAEGQQDRGCRRKEANAMRSRCIELNIGCKLYNSSCTPSLAVSPFFGTDGGSGSSFASFTSLFPPSREVAGLPSPDLGDLHGSGIGLAGSIGMCFTVPTLKYALCSAKNFFQ